ncbi:transglutaminase-like domain-containing protein [Peptoniphilus catoniae]|uniref:transglutaminase-like domain-containing protein n=1 Tax=Peptoniphilus catoniae TaxID=1660341 RepID=UPI0010FCFDE7|nr:transglutaminase-like domain-containing protein [Peptoniphilus catoniae]
MLEEKILTSLEELGLVVKETFFNASDQEFYKCITIKVDEGLKNYLSENRQRDGVDRPYCIPDIATLNYYLAVRVEDIRDKETYYECDLRVIFFAEKKAFKELIALEKYVKERTESLTDFEKVKYLNNFIIDKITYDKELKARSALYAIVRGKGTCTAFSELFLILGEASGLNVGSISSILMKHRWNYVVINEETYYIDVTFNEAIKDRDWWFFQNIPLHLEKAPDQKVVIKHRE